MGDRFEKQYLGDGVYARFEGYQVILTAEDGSKATDTIYLDEQVLAAFEKYIQKIKGTKMTDRPNNSTPCRVCNKPAELNTDLCTQCAERGLSPAQVAENLEILTEIERRDLLEVADRLDLFRLPGTVTVEGGDIVRDAHGTLDSLAQSIRIRVAASGKPAGRTPF